MKIPQTPFSTRLSGSAKETELRLRSIFQWKKKRPPIILFVLLAVLLLGICGGLASFSDQQAEERYLASLDIPGATVYAQRKGLRSFEVYWQPDGGIPELFETVTRAKVSTVELTEHDGKLAVRYTDSYNDLLNIRVFALSDHEVPEYLVGGASDPGKLPPEGAPGIEEILGLVPVDSNEDPEIVVGETNDVDIPPDENAGQSAADGGLLETMAAVRASDFINPEYFGNVTAEQLAAALNAAVDRQISEAEFMDAIGGAYGSVFPHWYIENAWLEGGPNTFSSLDRHLSVNCGLPENIVEVTLSEDNHRDTAYFEDAALYQMVRHKNDYEEIIDAEAYSRFEGELVREMKETLALFTLNPGNFTGYELKRFNLAWSYEDERTDSQVELYYFDFGLLTDTPEKVGWAGGMALDSELRVVGVGSGWFAARCRDGEVVCTTFVGNELYYSSLQNWDEADWAMEFINDSLDYAASNPLNQLNFIWDGDPVNFMELTIHLPDSWRGKVGYVRTSADFIQFYHLPSRQTDLYSGNLFSLGWSLGALALDYDVGNGQVLASTRNASYILTWPEEPQCPPAVYEEYAGMDLADVRIIPSQQLLNNSENRFS